MNPNLPHPSTTSAGTLLQQHLIIIHDFKAVSPSNKAKPSCAMDSSSTARKRKRVIPCQVGTNSTVAGGIGNQVELSVKGLRSQDAEETTNSKGKRQTKRLKTRRAPKPAGHLFPFLHLPPEIRNMIYSYCLVPRARRLPDLYGDSVPTSVLEFAPYQRSAKLSISLLRVSKQIHAEASDIFYKDNTISVRCCDKVDKNLEWKQEDTETSRRVHRSGRVTRDPHHDITHGSLFEHIFRKFRHFSFTFWYCCGFETRLAPMSRQIIHAITFSRVLLGKAKRIVGEDKVIDPAVVNCSYDCGNIKTLEIDLRMHCFHDRRGDVLKEIIAPAIRAFADLRGVEKLDVVVRRMARDTSYKLDFPGLDECVQNLKMLAENGGSCKKQSKECDEEEHNGSELPDTPQSFAKHGGA